MLLLPGATFWGLKLCAGVAVVPVVAFVPRQHVLPALAQVRGAARGRSVPEPVMELCSLLPGRARLGTQPCVRDLGSEGGKRTELSQMCDLGSS